MSASIPGRLARQASISSTSSADTSSHDHVLRYHSHNHHHITSWLRESWAPLFHRHEQIAVGAMSRGVALMTREMIEMQVQQAPNIRGMLDCLPSKLPARQATLKEEMFFRQKLGTWPLTKHEAQVARQFQA